MNYVTPLLQKKLFEKIIEVINNICLFPMSYPVVDNEFIHRNDIRKVIINNYIMYYIFEEDKNMVSIIRILYGKRNLEPLLKR